MPDVRTDALLFREAAGSAVVATAARLVFAAVLLIYYWSAGLTKLGPGLTGWLSPSAGAYVQIFPKAFEAAGYDTTQMSTTQTVIVLAGTWAEFLLPLLIVLGLATRLAALGMIGFVVVQSYVDVAGHGADAATVGTWFDRIPDSVILDQRALWVFLLLTLVALGGGPLALDRTIRRD